jgi:hypothetical protein
MELASPGGKASGGLFPSSLTDRFLIDKGGHADRTRVSEAVRLMGLDYIAKPWSNEVLLRSVRSKVAGLDYRAQVLGLRDDDPPHASHPGKLGRVLLGGGSGPWLVARRGGRGSGRPKHDLRLLHPSMIRLMQDERLSRSKAVSTALQWIRLGYVRHTATLAAWLAATRALILLSAGS